MRSRQSAECGGNQDVRYQEFSEMTLDYTKRFRWQETGSQGSFHVGMDRQPVRDFSAVEIVTSFGPSRFVTAEIYVVFICVLMGRFFYCLFFHSVV